MKRFMVILAVIVICFYTSIGISYAQHQESKSVSKHDSTHTQSHNNGSTTSNEAADSVSALRVLDAKASASMKIIVGRYLDLKNALAGDKTKEAATAGSALEAAFKMLDTNNLTASQMKVYAEVEDDAREHAEHIGANAGNIEHQREHFDMLSNDVYDLVSALGSGQLLYKDYCPMYNNKKGAIWLSDKKEIQNPYYGKKMLTCGSVKEEIH
jgi:hypothetical protein